MCRFRPKESTGTHYLLFYCIAHKCYTIINNKCCHVFIGAYVPDSCQGLLAYDLSSGFLRFGPGDVLIGRNCPVHHRIPIAAPWPPFTSSQ